MNILVLGVGNILFQDEGIGVRIIEELERRYLFDGQVRLLDGGSLGFRLVETIMEYDALIIVDAALWGGEAGQARLFDPRAAQVGKSFGRSIHQMNLPDTLALCEALGCRQKTVLIGVQPGNYTDMGDELTPAVKASVDAIIKLVLEQIKNFGGTWTERGKAG